MIEVAFAGLLETCCHDNAALAHRRSTGRNTLLDRGVSHKSQFGLHHMSGDETARTPMPLIRNKKFVEKCGPDRGHPHRSSGETGPRLPCHRAACGKGPPSSQRFRTKGRVFHERKKKKQEHRRFVEEPSWGRAPWRVGFLSADVIVGRTHSGGKIRLFCPDTWSRGRRSTAATITKK